MKLYQEIIFLSHFFDGKFCVENVKSYYQPLIPPYDRGRHYYWTNFKLPYKLGQRNDVNGVIGGSSKGGINDLCKFHDVDYDFLMSYKGIQRKDKLIRNLVDYEVGKSILEIATKGILSKNAKQNLLF